MAQDLNYPITSEDLIAGNYLLSGGKNFQNRLKKNGDTEETRKKKHGNFCTQVTYKSIG